QTGDVRRLFLRHGILLTGVGIAMGSGVALAFTRVMSALLFGVSPMDPVTYLAVSASLAIVALLATYLPARRASRVDPVVALRAAGALRTPAGDSRSSWLHRRLLAVASWRRAANATRQRARR